MTTEPFNTTSSNRSSQQMLESYSVLGRLCTRCDSTANLGNSRCSWAGGGGLFGILVPLSLPNIPPESQFSRNEFFKTNTPLHQTLVLDSKAEPNSKPNIVQFSFPFISSTEVLSSKPKILDKFVKIYIYILICYTIVFTSSSLYFWISSPFIYILNKNCFALVPARSQYN